MASSKDRQRKLARAKMDRQAVNRAQRERRRRRVMAGVGAGLAVVLILAGVGWLGGLFDSDPKTNTASTDTCLWTPQDATTNQDLKDVGTPPGKGIPTAGTRPLTITTNQGAPITVSLDLAKSPCGSESLTYLAQKKFYDNTECTELITDGALRCGDPQGNGLGGPTYSVYSENLPAKPDPSASATPAAAATKKPTYPKGTVALISEPPGQNGSQFLLFYKDSSPADPQYPIVGTVTGGLDTLAKIAAIPTVDNASGSKVKPKDKVLMQSVTAGEVVGATTPSSAAPSSSTQS